MNAIEIGILAILAIGVIAAWYFVFVVEKKKTQRADSDAFPVQEWEEITTHELGEIECNIKGLIRVIVAAHKVEAPTNALRKAVQKNLQNNVEYQFLVSKCHEKSERDGWYHMFLAIAHVVIKQAGSPRQSKDLVKIANLEYDWRDTPYIFYQAETTSGQFSTIAFRGNQTDEGIAEKYVRLPAWLAYSLALAIMSDAPHPMTVTEEPFHALPEIDPNALNDKGSKEKTREPVA